ncbi:MAG: V-type ATP synthase subunit D [Clostridiales bacterium]|nr:V-type ATP synthase subunit D [Clostridiales bacterium]
MTRLNVNPTRMELKKLKARLNTATRGHKLLKDKSEEMIRRFSLLIKENKRMRDDVEAELSQTLRDFSMAKSLMSGAEIEKAFSMPSATVQADFSTTHVMSVEVPEIILAEGDKNATLPYAFTEITSEADASVSRIGGVINKLLALAAVEKTAAMLALEIERNKRRVNALEYVMIPQLIETIDYIKAKLDENERAATTRLMKVKSMIAERA